MKNQSLLFLFALAVFCPKSALPAPIEALSMGAIVADLTLQEWTAEWWRWQLARKTSLNPILDATGICAHEGQSGPVFFIGGGLTTGGETTFVNRTVTVSSDKYIFFPIINFTGENVGRAVPLSPQQLRDEVVTFMASTEVASAQIDGVELPPDKILRLLAPVFSYTIPAEENLFQFFGLDHPGGVIDPAVSDGIWVMLAPLPLGTHTVRFLGAAGEPFNIGYNITYQLTVVEPGLAFDTEVLITAVQCRDFSPAVRHSLTAPLHAAQAAFERGKFRAASRQLKAFQHQVRSRFGKTNPDSVEHFIRLSGEILDKTGLSLTQSAGVVSEHEKFGGPVASKRKLKVGRGQ